MAASMRCLQPIFKFCCYSSSISRCRIISTSKLSMKYFHSNSDIRQLNCKQNASMFGTKILVAPEVCLSQIKKFSVETKLTVEVITQRVMDTCKNFDKIPSDKVSLESHFMNDLGLDSLDHVELIMNIEDEFSFEIPDADAEKLLRPQDIVNYVVQKEESQSQ